jgi:hypothetical protein
LAVGACGKSGNSRLPAVASQEPKRRLPLASPLRLVASESFTNCLLFIRFSFSRGLKAFVNVVIPIRQPTDGRKSLDKATAAANDYSGS